MGESFYSEIHYRVIYSFQRTEHNAEQQAHGNIYNTPGVCGLSYHLIKAISGTGHVAGQASKRVNERVGVGVGGWGLPFCNHHLIHHI